MFVDERTACLWVRWKDISRPTCPSFCVWSLDATWVRANSALCSREGWTWHAAAICKRKSNMVTVVQVLTVATIVHRVQLKRRVATRCA